MSALAAVEPIIDATIDLTHAEARALTDRIVTVAEELVDLLAQAHEGRAWIPLGYATWEEYLANEVGQALHGLTGARRRGVVGAFADSGLSTRAIQSALGLGSDQTVRADLKVVRPDGVGPRRGNDGKVYAAPAAIEAARKPVAVKTTTALELLELAGPDGMTIPELMRRKRWSYGQASATFSRLNDPATGGGTRRIERLSDQRGGYSVYVLPEHVGDRAFLTPGQRRAARA